MSAALAAALLVATGALAADGRAPAQPARARGIAHAMARATAGGVSLDPIR
jgi:hypothetical protein